MGGLISAADIQQTEKLYSLLGSKIISGDVAAVKYLYGDIWRESPPLIRTVSSLQENITAVEIESDTGGRFNPEFLYYWGMTCLGEQSALIFKDVETAESCFEKIRDAVPNAEARLAYIKLLKSDEPAKSECNVARLDILRRWAGKQDLFSRIVLARIVFYQFLNEREADNFELPIRVFQLLQHPCQIGHPVAVRFWKEILEYLGTPEAVNLRMNSIIANTGILYDFNSMQICK